MLKRDYILSKIEEYRGAYMDALATANANHGAMLAMEDALREFDKPDPAQEPEED